MEDGLDSCVNRTQAKAYFIPWSMMRRNHIDRTTSHHYILGLLVCSPSCGWVCTRTSKSLVGKGMTGGGPGLAQYKDELKLSWYATSFPNNYYEIFTTNMADATTDAMFEGDSGERKVGEKKTRGVLTG